MISPDALRGHQLVKVTRLAWLDRTEPSDLSVGPAHLVFDDGRGLVFSSRSDWSLDLVQTQPNDEGWLVPYDYDYDGSRWVLRDASSEQPFATVIGRALVDWELILNEMDEAVGATIDFEGSSLVLEVWEGEIKA
jgi:hypothetical protein